MQMKEFDQVNSMSCQLIEQLQGEVDMYKLEYERMKTKYDEAFKQSSNERIPSEYFAKEDQCTQEYY